LVAGDEQLEAHHAADAELSGLRAELRPAVIGSDVGPDDLLFPGRVHARPLLEPLLQGVDRPG
jgi:hypothetical protein